MFNMKIYWIIFTIIQELFISQVTSEEEYAPVQVDGVLHEVTDIPCNLFSDNPEDKINLILWYKDDKKDPIYSYDARRSVFTSDRHHLKDLTLRGRAVFEPSKGEGDPNKLRLSRVTDADAGTYRCRVDFMMAQSSTRSAILRVITPVSSVLITDGEGHPAPAILPPVPEGGTLNITCTAHGGRPSPKVTWWLEDAMVDKSFLEVTPGVVSNNLVISPLTRAHAHSVLTCKASPSPVSTTEATATVDMHLRPESVKVSGLGTGKSVRVGDMLDLNCIARGSRPPPMITWYKGNKPIHTQSPGRKSVPGVNAVSHVRVQVEREDNGLRVTCRVTNLALPQHVTQGYITLNVTYPPELELRMGAKMDSTVIKEKIDLYLTCHVDANPRPIEITFSHQGKAIEQDLDGGVIVTGSNLVLRNVKRSQAGAYTCAASNSEGTGVSVPINITVLYAPVCAEAKDVWADQGSQVKASCRVHSSPNTPINFYWVWLTPTYTRRIISTQVTSQGSKSEVSFSVPEENITLQEINKKYQLGILQCWADNIVGKMENPCSVAIYRPAPPSPPENCSIIGANQETVTVKCQTGNPSVLTHNYNMRIYESQSQILLINETSVEPIFTVRGLMSGRNYIIRVSAHTKYGKSRDEVLEPFNFKTAENRMRKDEDDLPWTNIFIFVGGVGGAVILVLLIVALVRLRFRRSQHKCTVRRIPPGEEHHKDILTSSVNTPIQEKKSPISITEKQVRSEITTATLTQPMVSGNVSHPLSDSSPKENTQLQPIIRQPSVPRLQPIIKENGRAEPVKNTQPSRTVLFVEPPKHDNIIINKPDVSRQAYESPYIHRRSSSSKNHDTDALSPHMYMHPHTHNPRGTYADPITSYPEREHRYRSHVDDEGIETLDHQYSSGSSNTLSRESGYCSPRHHLQAGATYTRGVERVPTQAEPIIHTREQAHVFTFPNSQNRSFDYSQIPPRGRTTPAPLPSIMKKSPSVSGDVSHYYENNPRRMDTGTRYRSLPRPGKPRENDMDNLARYQSLDRRFDIPFTGSLPRPERRTSGDSSMAARRRNSSTRLRFADEKLFHVYPEKNKRQNAVDDDADENFV